jgi:hypothetical protein
VRWPIERTVVLLALVGLARIAFFHFVSEPVHEPRRAHIDARFRALRTLLPAQGPIGYLSDEPPASHPAADPTGPGTRLYEEAQYALAPLVLLDGDDRQEVVLAQVRDPAHLPRLARQHGLRIAVTAGPNLAILRR